MTGFCLVCGANTEPDAVIVAGDLEIDHARGRAALRGSALTLTPGEFQVLHSIAKARGCLVTKGVLAERIGHEGDGNVLEVLISRIRRKVVTAGGANPIVTVRSAGVRLADAYAFAEPVS